MPSRIVLAWTVDVTNTPFGPTQAVTALQNVALYESLTNDPVLGQLFGLTIHSDITAQSGASTATRTLTLNMTSTDFAPSPFPCHPVSSTPPEPPFPLRKTITLPGSFFVTKSSPIVATTVSQIPSIAQHDVVQFLSQLGVFYEVISIGATMITLGTIYSGPTQNTGAFKEPLAPVTLAAIYSTSSLDTSALASTPAIPAGPGARTVLLSYKDSTGAGPFAVTVNLTGKRPAQVILAGGSIDIAEIDSMTVLTTGSFGNSVGQITLASLSSPIPVAQVGTTDTEFLTTLTDEAQMLLDQPLVYLPPSYFSLAQQTASNPQLKGDFIVTTGSASVPTTVDQTGVLSPGSVLQFARQLTNNRANVFYTVLQVTPKIVTLTTPFSGIDNNNTGTRNVGTNSNAGTMGNLGDEVQQKATAAFLVPNGSQPSSNSLSWPLSQFLETYVAAPPMKPPLDPSTIPAPTFLSGLFTQTLQKALAVPVVPQHITFI